MLDHLDDVSISLRNEGVRHEMWFMGRDIHHYFSLGSPHLPTSLRYSG